MRHLQECKKHQPKKWALYGMMALLLALTGFMVVAIIWLIRPYDLVRFGDPTSTVLTTTVPQGGNIVVQNPSFCVDDVDTTVERWADALDKEGRVVASFQMYSIEFFGKGRGLVCNSPSVVTVALPNYVIGMDGGAGTFKLRQVISYRPNPVRIVKVDLQTTAFVVLPTSKEKQNG